MTKPPTNESVGRWNAWVEQAPDHQREARLALVPEHLREDVRRHLATVDAIHGFHMRKAKHKARR